MFSLTERTLGRMSRSRCIRRMLTLIRHLVGIDRKTNAEDVVYPMNADFYINGVMSTSVYSLRFIVDTYKPYIVGMSPSGKDGFVGRVFNLMVRLEERNERKVINYDLKKETIRAVYKGDGSVVSQLQSQAVLVMGTNEFDIGGAGKKE